MTEKSAIHLEHKPTLDALPIDPLNFMDDLNSFGQYLECLLLAIPEACSDMLATNALQAYLMLIQDKFEDIKERVEYERQRQILHENVGR